MGVVSNLSKGGLIIKKIKTFVSLAFIITLLFIFTSCSLNQSTQISFKDYSKELSADDIYTNILVLANKDNARITGFDGEKDAAAYISKQFKSIGLEVELQGFPITAFQCNGTELKVNGKENIIMSSKALTFTAPTPKEGFTAKIVDGDMGTEDLLKEADVKNKIVLMKRGGDFFKVKTERAAKQGALGVIFYDPDPKSEQPISASLSSLSKIPAISIGRIDGESLKKQISSNKNLEITLKVDSICAPSESQNVIATLKAEKETKDTKTLVIGAHYDGVDTPAANDNASGISTVIEIAKLLSKGPVKCNVKFIAFGSEETGLIGSTYFVDNLGAEISNMIGMINLDMVGVGNKLTINTLLKDSKTFPAELAEACAKDFNYSYTRNESSRSDHVPFAINGIAEVFFEYGPSTGYHTDEDNISIIEKDALAKVCNIATSIANEIATKPDKYIK
jgi:aminopeptidase YwaD